MSKPIGDARGRGSRGWRLVAAVAALAAAIVAVVLLWPRPATEDAGPVRTPEPTPTRTATPSPSPTPTGFPEDTEEYDLTGLPQADVFAVIPALPVDADPAAPFPGF